MNNNRSDIPDDPQFTHYVVEGGYLIGEAKDVKQETHGISFGYVKLWGMEEFAEYGSIEDRNLISKKVLRRYLKGDLHQENI